MLSRFKNKEKAAESAAAIQQTPTPSKGILQSLWTGVASVTKRLSVGASPEQTYSETRIKEEAIEDSVVKEEPVDSVVKEEPVEENVSFTQPDVDHSAYENGVQDTPTESNQSEVNTQENETSKEPETKKRGRGRPRKNKKRKLDEVQDGENGKRGKSKSKKKKSSSEKAKVRAEVAKNGPKVNDRIYVGYTDKKIYKATVKKVDPKLEFHQYRIHYDGRRKNTLSWIPVTMVHDVLPPAPEGKIVKSKGSKKRIIKTSANTKWVEPEVGDVKFDPSTVKPGDRVNIEDVGTLFKATVRSVKTVSARCMYQVHYDGHYESDLRWIPDTMIDELIPEEEDME